MDETGDTKEEMERFNCFKESSVHQVICAILINIPVFCCGMEVGWMSPMILLFQSERSPSKRRLTDDEISWITASAYFSCLPMVPIIAGISDKIGRKRVLIFMSFSALLCWVTKLCTQAVLHLMMARLLIGITMAGSLVLCPLYTHEISVHSTKKIMAPMGLIFHTAGIMIFYVIGGLCVYRVTLWISMGVPIAQIILFLMMPESPYYLIKRNKIEEAKRALAYLRSRPRDDQVLVQEIERIQEELEKYKSCQKVLTHFRKNKALQRAFTVTLVMFLSQRLCGVTCVHNFAGKIFSLAGKYQKPTLEPNKQAMIMGAVQFCGSISGYYLIRRYPRKTLLQRSVLMYTVGMAIVATWFLFCIFEWTILRFCRITYVPVIWFGISLFWYAAGFLPTTFMLGWELFTIKHRESMLTITTTAAAAADCLQMAAFIPISYANGIYISFYFFSLVCFMTMAFDLWKVPETKNRSVSQIYAELEIQSVKTTAPQNEASD